jgi:hypothetical protein
MRMMQVERLIQSFRSRRGSSMGDNPKRKKIAAKPRNRADEHKRRNRRTEDRSQHQDALKAALLGRMSYRMTRIICGAWSLILMLCTRRFHPFDHFRVLNKETVLLLWLIDRLGVQVAAALRVGLSLLNRNSVLVGVGKCLLSLKFDGSELMSGQTGSLSLA